VSWTCPRLERSSNARSGGIDKAARSGLAGPPMYEGRPHPFSKLDDQSSNSQTPSVTLAKQAPVRSAQTRSFMCPVRWRLGLPKSEMSLLLAKRGGCQLSTPMAITSSSDPASSLNAFLLPGALVVPMLAATSFCGRQCAHSLVPVRRNTDPTAYVQRTLTR